MNELSIVAHFNENNDDDENFSIEKMKREMRNEIESNRIQFSSSFSKQKEKKIWYTTSSRDLHATNSWNKLRVSIYSRNESLNEIVFVFFAFSNIVVW